MFNTNQINQTFPNQISQQNTFYNYQNNGILQPINQLPNQQTNNRNNRNKGKILGSTFSIMNSFDTNNSSFGSNNNYSFNQNIVNKKTIEVFVDGACENNGRKNSIAGAGIYFPNGELQNVPVVIIPVESEIGKCTNNVAELSAILCTCLMLKESNMLEKYRIKIYSDSDYSVKAVTSRIKKWMNNGWLTANNKPVKNKQLIVDIYEYLNNPKYEITIEHIRGHLADKNKHLTTKMTMTEELQYKIRCNQEADRLAKEAVEYQKNQ